MLSLEVVIIVVVAVLPTLYDVVLTLAVITVAPLLRPSVRPPSSTQLLATARVSPASGNNNNSFAGRFLMLSVSRLTRRTFFYSLVLQKELPVSHAPAPCTDPLITIKHVI